MRRVGTTLLLLLMLAGCTSATPRPQATAPPAPAREIGAPQHEQSALDRLRGIEVRDLLPDQNGMQFLVLDRAMRLYRLGLDGQSELGDAPELGLVAAWAPGDAGFAYARKSSGGTYEIVGVGHEGSKVLAQAVGYPGLIHFQGQELQFIDAEGWKAVSWSAAPVLKSPLALGARANQKAWCTWTGTGPVCAGGYWDGAGGGDQLTLVRAGSSSKNVTPKGGHPILAGAAFSADGRMMAAILGSRSAGSPDLGRIVVAWLDPAGNPVKTRDFPIVASHIAFDAYGRLIIRRFAADGSGAGQLVALEPDSGLIRELEDNSSGGFVIDPDGKHLYLLSQQGAVTRVALTPPAATPRVTVTAGFPSVAVWRPPQASLTTDLPTYPPEARWSWSPGLTPPAAFGGLDDLARLAAHLETAGTLSSELVLMASYWHREE